MSVRRWLTLFLTRRTLKVGDRVRIYGGYQVPPQWLGTAEAVYGTVLAFVPSESAPRRSDAVVRLEQPLAFMRARGNIMIMSLRYVNQRWRRHGVVHLELYGAVPASPGERREDAWIESHAKYEIDQGNSR
jgi:hypothetical protein